jgi:hypothetical protein
MRIIFLIITLSLTRFIFAAEDPQKIFDLSDQKELIEKATTEIMVHCTTMHQTGSVAPKNFVKMQVHQEFLGEIEGSFGKDSSLSLLVEIIIEQTLIHASNSDLGNFSIGMSINMDDSEVGPASMWHVHPPVLGLVAVLNGDEKNPAATTEYVSSDQIRKLSEAKTPFSGLYQIALDKRSPEGKIRITTCLVPDTDNLVTLKEFPKSEEEISQIVQQEGEIFGDDFTPSRLEINTFYDLGRSAHRSPPPEKIRSGRLFVEILPENWREKNERLLRK